MTRAAVEAIAVLEIAANWSPPKFFLALALAFGLGFLVINPPLAVNDEDVHLARVYELATGRLLTRSDEQGEYHHVPEDYAALSAAYVQIREPGESARIDPREIFQRLLDNHPKELVRVPGRAGTYAPICYLPQVLAVALLRPFDVSVLVHLYAARLASLLQYIWLAWLAVTVSTSTQWIFIVIALTPIALTQAAGVSADGTVIGLSLLFFSLACKLVCSLEGRASVRGQNSEAPETDAPTRRDLSKLAVTAVLLTLCKPVYLVAIVCLFALFWTRPANRRQTVAFLAGTSVLAACFYLAWSWLIPAQPGPDNPIYNSGLQLAYLREHPLHAFSAAYHTLLYYGDNILIQSIFVRGRMSNMIRFASGVVVALHLQLSLGLAFGSLKHSFRHAPRTRRLVAFWFSLSALSIVFAVSAGLFVCCTEVGAELTRHLQGRYYLPAVPAILLACAFVGKPVFARWLRAGRGLRAFAILSFNNALCLFTLVGFHYFPAGIEWPF